MAAAQQEGSPRAAQEGRLDVTEWVVEVVVDTGELVSDGVLETLMDRGERRDDAFVARYPGPCVVVTQGFHVDVPLEAHRRGVELAAEILDGHVTGEVVDVRVCLPEIYEEEAIKPDTPPLLSSPDVAELLGVSRQRVHQLDRDHPQFPPPYARLGAGPIWTLPQIEHFAKVWVRKPGRPARTG